MERDLPLAFSPLLCTTAGQQPVPRCRVTVDFRMVVHKEREIGSGPKKPDPFMSYTIHAVV